VNASVGIIGVALSLPTIVGTDGSAQVVVPEMDDAERSALERSASVLRNALASLGPN
jgi:L-lactate dehydrogenase